MNQDKPTYTPTEYLYTQVANHITDRIKQGQLHPGDRLPAERQLAEELGVTHHTTRRAISELRKRHLVTTLPGKGTYVLGLRSG